MYVEGGVRMCVCSSLVRFLLFGSLFKKLKSDYNQIGVKDAIGVPSYVNEVNLRSCRVVL